MKALLILFAIAVGVVAGKELANTMSREGYPINGDSLVVEQPFTLTVNTKTHYLRAFLPSRPRAAPQTQP